MTKKQKKKIRTITAIVMSIVLFSLSLSGVPIYAIELNKKESLIAGGYK